MNEWKNMNNSRRNLTDQAVVGVVTAILLTGIVVAVISLVQTVYVPKMMEQREAEHMDKVAEQFAYLASVIDGQASDKTKGIPIATSITLGSKELPYLLSVRAYGTLEILKNACTIAITNETIASTHQIDTISYSSVNAYFLDQAYTYEAGAMIVSQDEGNLMMIRPGLYVDFNLNKQRINISFDVVNISSMGQKIIASGYGTYPIQTEFNQVSVDTNLTQVHQITLISDYANAWKVFLNRTMIQEGLNFYGYGTDYSFQENGDSLTIVFSPDLSVNVVFKIIDIGTQIGPGWVE